MDYRRPRPLISKSLAFAVLTALTAAVFLSHAAQAQQQGSTCSDLNRTIFPWYMGRADNHVYICDGSIFQTLLTATESPMQIGLGTTTPGAGLDVQFPETAAGGIAYGSRYQQTLTAAANNDSLTALYINPAFTNGAFTGVANYGLIVASGNVGIGTTSPVSALHVHGDYNNTGSGGITLDASDGGAWSKYSLQINPYVVAGAEVGYQFQTTSLSGGTQNPLTFNNAGNVGIGTTIPGTKLHVYTASSGLTPYAGTGLTLESNTANYLSLLSGSENGIFFGTTTNINGGIIYNNSGDVNGMQFRTGGNTIQMAITSAGNIGIGTTSPADSLDIGSRTDALTLPVGTTGQRPTPVNGMLRYNSTVPQVEAYYSGAWNALGGGSSGGTITLGTSASVTNPERPGDATTGLFSATAGTVSISSAGSDVIDVSGTGPNILGTITQGSYSVGYQINGNNAVWQDAAHYNTAVGDTALPTTLSQTGGGTNGLFDFAAGYQGLNANTTGAGNTAAGAYTLAANTTGAWNSAFGVSALQRNTIGQYNTGVGANALFNSTTGSGVTAVGYNALYLNTTGVNNTALGLQAGYDVSSGSHNVIIGDYATTGVGITTGSNNILIGQNLQELTQTSSNQLDIGNLIFATGLASGTTMSSGNVGIGTASPGYPFTVYSASANQAYFASTGANNGTVLIDNAAGGHQSVISLMDAGTQKWLIGKNTDNTFLLWDAAHTKNTLQTDSSGDLILEGASGNVGIGSTSPVASLDLSQKTDALALPGGTTGQRPTAAAGMIRYNTTNNGVEGYVNGTWAAVPVIVATADATAQGANIAAATLLTPGANTWYRATCSIVVTRAATTSSTLPVCNVIYTDPDTNASATRILSGDSTVNTVGTYDDAVLGLGGAIPHPFLMIYAKSGVAVQYSTTGYVSSGGTSLQYAVHVKLEQMQ